MQCRLTPQEKLKDLRNKKGLNLVQVANATDDETALELVNKNPDFPQEQGDDMQILEQGELVRMSKMLDLNLLKYNPIETQVLMYLIKKGSRNPIFKNPPKGRGKKN